MSLRTAARAAVAAGVLVTTALAGAVVASPASAAANPTLTLAYDVTGSTTLTNPNSQVTVQFAPTVLTSTIDLSTTPGGVTATMPLAPVVATFKAYGFLPARGTVVFTAVKPIKGTLDLGTPEESLHATALYVVSLRDVVIGGAKANVGTSCQTVFPVRVAVTSEPDFAALTSGTFDGVYDLGKFQNCGKAQTIINDTLPGKGNTLTLKVNLRDDSASKAAVAAMERRAA